MTIKSTSSSWRLERVGSALVVSVRDHLDQVDADIQGSQDKIKTLHYVVVQAKETIRSLDYVKPEKLSYPPHIHQRRKLCFDTNAICLQAVIYDGLRFQKGANGRCNRTFS